MNRIQDHSIAGLPFAGGAAVWLESRRPYLAPRTYTDYSNYIKALSGFFVGLNLTDIYGEDVRMYQRDRSQRVCASKVNQECSILQQMLKRIGRWQEIDYQALPVHKTSPGRALSDDEYERLFRIASSRSHWEMAYMFAVISVNTTAGPKEVWSLRLQDVNLQERTIRVQPEGAKNVHRVRVLPLNEAAFAAIGRAIELAKERGSVAPEHYVFPFRLKGNAYAGTYDPTKRCKTCRTAWAQPSSNYCRTPAARFSTAVLIS
jgi:integrase